jgi:mitochondrial chaperone BCS1
VADINKFLESAQWYVDKGVPYRRGYLFYGPPGTGKTSFTEVIAGVMGMDVCYLNLGSENLDDDSVNTALNTAPPRSIILLEDIDALFVGREAVTKNTQKQISFSGLLNALDGVRSQEGRIVFMTTNHPEKLDPALMRPGRADFHALINYGSYDQMRRMFLKFNPGMEDLAIQFAR